MTEHEHHWETVVASGVWAETAWQIRGCECGAVIMRPKIPGEKASFWEVDPRGSFKAVQPLVVEGQPGQTYDDFDIGRTEPLDGSPVGGTWTGDGEDFTIRSG